MVGFYTPPAAPFLAFLYSNRNMTDLGTLGGARGGYSSAESINGSGQVAGFSSIADTTHAFLYVNGSMINLAPWGAGSITDSASTTLFRW